MSYYRRYVVHYCSCVRDILADQPMLVQVLGSDEGGGGGVFLVVDAHIPILLFVLWMVANRNNNNNHIIVFRSSIHYPILL
jgi:hypothetical protein